MRQCRNASELEQATLKSGAVAQNIGDVDKAMAGSSAPTTLSTKAAA
jgi:hypothetical protein